MQNRAQCCSSRFLLFCGFGLLHISSVFGRSRVGGPLAQFLFKALDLLFTRCLWYAAPAQLSLKIESLTGNLEGP